MPPHLDVLPDSRAKVSRDVIMAKDDDGVVREYVRTYCANCGQPHGHVTATARAIVVLCARCVEMWGVPAGLALAPKSVWSARVQEATQELSIADVIRLLDDPNSTLSKLAGEVARASRWN